MDGGGVELLFGIGQKGRVGFVDFVLAGAEPADLPEQGSSQHST